MKYIPDTYTLKARIAPVLLVALPLTLMVLCWQSDVLAKWKTLWAVVLASGGGIILAQFGRDAGKLKEKNLFDSWDGSPTTRKLRHRQQDNPELLKRYHENIRKISPELRIPTPEEEKLNPQEADKVYETVVSILREKTRDKKRFELVFKENCNYGFRRNLWGLKVLGQSLSIICTVLVLIVIICKMVATNNLWEVDTLHITCFAFNILLIYLWLGIVRPEWVKVAADSYADRLLGTMEILVEGKR